MMIQRYVTTMFIFLTGRGGQEAITGGTKMLCEWSKSHRDFREWEV